MGITQQIGASSIIRPGVIDNTAARPASPYEGQVIFQKDIDKVLFWNGTAWRFMGDSTAQAESSMDDIGLRKIVSGSLAGGDTNFVGCFSSAYNVYEIYITNVRASGNAEFYFRMLSGTTVANTNNYDTQRFGVQGASLFGVRNLATIGRIGYMGGGTNQLSHYRMTLVNPNIAKYTFSISKGSYSDSTILANIEENNVAHTLANAYDGIVIGSTATSTVEGTVTIYGVKQ